MKGFELIFMAPRSRRHDGKPTLDAILKIAREHGIRTHTRRSNTEGTGAKGHTHSAHFFELADEPEELLFVLDPRQSEALMHSVEAEGIHVFCVRRAIEYWQFG